MSKQATETVTYPDPENGQMVTVVTDKETAKAIKEYHGVYNQIQHYNITLCKWTDLGGQICEIYKAQTRKTKIWCMRKYIPLIGEECHECRIERKKKGQTQPQNNEPELILGGVEYLYYKLLSKNCGQIVR